jgi:hypothetical protein
MTEPTRPQRQGEADGQLTAAAKLRR